MGTRRIVSFSKNFKVCKRFGSSNYHGYKKDDIGSTSEAYANAWLGDNYHFYADAFTVNPWMVLETICPFIKIANEKGKGVFILLKTSNSGSKDIQSLEVNGESVFLKIKINKRKITT